MFTAALHPRTASSYARRAQIGFVALGAGATALAAYALKAPHDVETPTITVPSAGAPKGGGAAKAEKNEPFDSGSTARRLALVANHPTAAEKAATPTSEDVTPPGSMAEDGSVKFIGTLTEATRRVALLKIGEKQRLLAAGESADDVTVVDVQDDHVEIKKHGAPQSITKQARSGPAVTYVSASVAGPAGAPGGDAGNFAGAAQPAGPGVRPKRPGRQLTPAEIEAQGRASREAAEAVRRQIRENGEHP